MLVTCAECNTSFTMDDKGIKKSGSKVRCSRCKNIFLVYPPESDLTPEILEDFAEKPDVLEPGSDKKEDLPEGEEIDFDELDRMFEADDELELKEFKEVVEEEPALPGVGDIDLSDLEKMLETSEIKLDEMGLDKKGVKDMPGDDEAFDLSELETAIDKSGDDGIEETEEEPEELNLDFEPEKDETISKIEDVEEIDFSDLEDMDISGETAKPSEKQEVEAEELELNLDLEPTGVEAEAHADEVAELDFSDVDKELEMEPNVSSEEPEHEDVHKHLEGFEIDKFQETLVMGEKNAPVAVAEEEEKDKKEDKKARKPLKITPPSGRFIIILGVIVILLLGAGAFVVYNPFDIEMPFVSDFLGLKADEKGNLKITPVADSIKGDYVDTKLGTLFLIKGDVKNDYKDPRSYIRVVGKVYAKGKKLSKTETVFCGNILPEQDISNLEPAVLKKRLQNRIGDKKSNVKVKPGSTIPFMIIYENPSLDLDEFIVEAEGSIKE